jgi:hypothetical protein
MSESVAQLDAVRSGSISRIPGILWVARQQIAVGVVAAAIVFVLRHEGVLVGHLAVGVAALCFVFAPGPRQIADRTLLAFALVLGFFPLVGWVPGLELKIDVPGILLAIAAGTVCGYQFRKLRLAERMVAIPTPAEILALIAGVAVTWWWALPWARLSVSGILGDLYAGWDNDSHFDMFAENLKLGSFIQARPDLPNGTKLLGYDYPQGIHQAWAQYIRLLNPRPPTTLPWLIHSYLDVLLLTTGAIVILGCMAVCRLSRRDLLTALPVMAIVVALFGFGSLGPFTGFPNFDLAIVAAAVCVSLMIRPSLGARANFFAVAGMGLIVVYNWYPLVILIAPAIVVAALRARGESRGRMRDVMTATVVVTAVAYVLPAAFTLHRGVSTLNVQGGLEINPSWGLLVVTIAALVGVAAYQQVSNPDRVAALVIAGPAILGGGLVLVSAVYTAASTGSVTYYGEKIAEGVLGVCLLVLAYAIASSLTGSRLRRSLSKPFTILAAVLLTVAALQVDGYVGPSSKALQSINVAYGISVHEALGKAPTRSRPLEEALRAAQEVQVIRGSDTSEQWWYVDPVRPSAGRTRAYRDFSLLAEWFIDLLGDPSATAYNYSGSVLGTQFEHIHSISEAARIVIRDFPSPQTNHTHLVVPSWLEPVIIREDPVWGQPGLLIAGPYVRF